MDSTIHLLSQSKISSLVPSFMLVFLSDLFGTALLVFSRKCPCYTLYTLFPSRWSEEGFKFYSGLATSSEACESGCMVMAGYVFSRTPIIVSTFRKKNKVNNDRAYYQNQNATLNQGETTLIENRH